MSRQRRVVLTGIGIVSSIGIGKDAFWAAALKGKTGVTEIKGFDTSMFKCRYGGEVLGFSPEDFIPRRKIKFLGRTSQLAIVGSSLALEDAKFPCKKNFGDKFGVIIGTTVGERPMEEVIAAWAKGGLKDIDRNSVFQVSASNISANVGIFFNAKGLNCVIPTACAAGNYALGYGYDLIRSGDLNFVLAGGAEAFSHVAFAGFQRLYSMSPDVCRPFDKDRKGIILGEGAGILFLESLDSALKRNAPIYAEVLGYGLSCDAYHITAPHPEGIKKAMTRALNDSGIGPEGIDYICAHGTGTPMNDKTESGAINEIFGERTPDISVNSIKSMLGHTMGAASAIESGVCALSIQKETILPTINFETPDPECNVDCTPNKARKRPVRAALNNGFAFGGNNCCVVFGKL
ncbi:MAG: beta-ketoacyl-[acyl-carrier-protein] synthase family protein [Candidatus Omnitrophica bacterium]|nr:beta-ketoacyl-[acyl-carrier-protein] synthase family protein [Candidatus Omnitrophota bacterium]